METAEKIKISKKLQENIEFIKQELDVDNNFDVILREIKIGGKDAAFLFIDGLVKDYETLKILELLMHLPREETVPNTINKLVREHIGYIEVETVESITDLINQVLAGPLAILVDGQDEAIILDVREYPARGPEEPDLEKVVRGSRDGFVETLVFNTALIRRRIRDSRLRMEIRQVGKRSKSDIVISYIEDIANPELIQQVKDLIEKIDIDGLPMAEKSLEELITPGSYWNPLPKVRYTERPDVAAVHLLEGHVLIITDNSPSVIILPATYWHHVQHAEEYRQNPIVGVYIRWVRFLAIFSSVFVLPVWFLVSLQPELLPQQLRFIGPEEVGKVPLLWQFIMAEFAIDFLRMAAIHTPSPLATSLGLIAAILIGQVAIDIGLFAPEVLLYVSVAAVGTFSTPSYELSNANRLIRFMLVILVGLFQLPGFILGLVLAFGLIIFTKSFGVPYFWPLIPLNLPALKGIIVRSPVPIQNVRPSMLKPRDFTKQAVSARKPEGNKNKKQKKE
jgi:stage V sporulation protein AF